MSNEYYRNVYLKSEHWQNLRLAKLAASKGQCCICGTPAWNNDVHHIVYRSLYNVHLNDLRVLCRRCHAAVHKVLEEFPEIKDEARIRRNWKATQNHVREVLQNIKSKDLHDLKVKRTKMLHPFRIRCIVPIKTWQKLVWNNPEYTLADAKWWTYSAWYRRKAWYAKFAIRRCREARTLITVDIKPNLS